MLVLPRSALPRSFEPSSQSWFRLYSSAFSDNTFQTMVNSSQRTGQVGCLSCLLDGFLCGCSTRMSIHEGSPSKFGRFSVKHMSSFATKKGLG